MVPELCGDQELVNFDNAGVLLPAGTSVLRRANGSVSEVNGDFTANLERQLHRRPAESGRGAGVRLPRRWRRHPCRQLYDARCRVQLQAAVERQRPLGATNLGDRYPQLVGFENRPWNFDLYDAYGRTIYFPYSRKF